MTCHSEDTDDSSNNIFFISFLAALQVLIILILIYLAYSNNFNLFHKKRFSKESQCNMDDHILQKIIIHPDYSLNIIRV